jgi:hypothetical protein
VPEVVVERVEVPSVPPEIRMAVIAVGDLLENASRLHNLQATALADAFDVTTHLREALEELGQPPALASAQGPAPTPTGQRPVLRSVPTAPDVGQGDDELTPAEREILVAQQPAGWNGQDLAVLVGKRYSGGFRNYLSSLRTKGYIEGANKATMRVTDAGVAALGSFTPLPTGRALLEHWLTGDRITPAEKDILRTLDAHPGLDGAGLAAREGVQRRVPQLPVEAPDLAAHRRHQHRRDAPQRAAGGPVTCCVPDCEARAVVQIQIRPGPLLLCTPHGLEIVDAIEAAEDPGPPGWFQPALDEVRLRAAATAEVP